MDVGQALTDTLTGTTLPPPGWADLTWQPENGCLRGTKEQDNKEEFTALKQVGFLQPSLLSMCEVIKT